MNKTLRRILSVSAWAAAILAGLFVLAAAYLSLRYSPEYMYRELFLDLGNPYDFRWFAERKLTASPDPYHFREDASKEALVQQAFASSLGNGQLDRFLAETGTQAFLVIKDDTLIYERYFMGYQRDSVVTSFSVAKSFSSTLVGIAAEEGAIKSIDDPITDYVPELAARDPRFQDISIRHLLMMASGMRFDPERPASLGDDSLTYAFDDLRHLALTETEVLEPPGQTFLYSDFHPQLLGMILERTTGKHVTDYLQEKLWTPIGMEYGGSWSLDSNQTGFELMAAGINARAIDFAKLGRLFLNKGNWNGQQIVSPEWVAQATQDAGVLKQPPIHYGYMWWGQNCSPQSPDFFATGNFGQFIYVSPARNLIIVRNAESWGLPGELGDWARIFCKFEQSMP